MKANALKFFKGIRFQTWLIFTLFASMILLFLWVLQVNLVAPYYRSSKINTVQEIADRVETMLYNDESLSSIEQTVRDNALCLSIVDNNSNYTNFNGIGSSCFITSSDFSFPKFYIDIVNSDSKDANFFIDNGEEMIVYGRQISPHLGNFILLINARVTPESAGFALILNQFVILTIIVLIIATIASLIIARTYSEPFIALTNSARKLAEGNLDVYFDNTHSMYNEVNDLADSLNYATNKLKKIDELRLDLIANVSHDIKTPLTMIMTYAEMISDFSKDDEALLMEHLKVIRSEADYLDRLVEDILELSVLQSGNLLLNLSDINLNDLITQTIAHFNVDIKFYYDAEYIVHADDIKITQVLHNFITNAIKHSKAKLIEVEIKRHKDKVRVSVIDNGQGIEEENLENIWERYYKIDKNFHRDISSSGLGLSISKGIIDAHNEIIGVNSKLNEGSEFFFELKFTKIIG